MKKQVIKQIFIDHWDEFKKIYFGKIRENVYREVEKMINCGSIENGFIEFKCEACGETKKVGFTCKSRFCTSCGKVHVDNWVEDLTAKLIKTKHRHMVFTIPKELREWFRADRKLLNLLPQCASKAIKSWFRERNKKENFMPGIIAVIHTFGRDLKWNPHVHVLLTEGAVGELTEWKNFSHIPYAMLRNRWQKLLLDGLTFNINKNIKKFKSLKNELYKKLDNGFYVYAKGVITSAEAAGRYVGRYTARPAMAQSRIVSYDGKVVKFYYERHEDGERIEVELNAIEFIKKLIIHIPEKNFKMVRYYGIYANNNSKKDVKLIKFINEKIADELKKLRKWKYRILKAFGVDPLKCSKCGQEMKIQRIYHHRYGDIMSKLVEKIKNDAYKRIAQFQEMYITIKNITCGNIEPLFV